MGSGVTAAAVEAAQPQPGMQVLDVASGTGEPAISLADRVGPQGHVTGVDTASTALATAEQRAAKRGLKNVTFLTADVHHLPFPEASFDLVTSRFGLMFFADLPRALSEMRRVLKPGGRVAFVTWGQFEQPYFTSTVVLILSMVKGAEMPAGARAMFKFGSQGAMSAALSGAGFVDVEEEFRAVPWVWPGPPEQLWEYFREVTIPFRLVLDSVPAERKEEVEGKILQALRQYYDGAQVNLTATIVVGTGRK